MYLPCLNLLICSHDTTGICYICQLSSLCLGKTVNLPPGRLSLVKIFNRLLKWIICIYSDIFSLIWSLHFIAYLSLYACWNLQNVHIVWGFVIDDLLFTVACEIFCHPICLSVCCCYFYWFIQVLFLVMLFCHLR